MGQSAENDMILECVAKSATLSHDGYFFYLHGVDYGLGSNGRSGVGSCLVYLQWRG